MHKHKIILLGGGMNPKKHLKDFGKNSCATHIHILDLKWTVHKHKIILLGEGMDPKKNQKKKSKKTMMYPLTHFRYQAEHTQG